MAASVSTLPWIWVIEALASVKEVDASLLFDIVKMAPDISDDRGKNAREMVSLRILESFFARQSGSKNGGSAIDSKIKLDPSKHCEDVVREILHELANGNTTGLSKTSRSTTTFFFPEFSKANNGTLLSRPRKCTAESVSWEKPNATMIKINVDAGFDRGRNRCGIGAIARNSLGEVVGISINVYPSVRSPRVAEALAIRHGMQLGTISLQLLHVIIESDALTVTQACNNFSDPPAPSDIAPIYYS